jgi:hypothetical protein
VFDRKATQYEAMKDIEAGFSLQDIVHLLKTREKLAEEWLSIATGGHTSNCIRVNGALEQCPSRNNRGRKAGWYQVVNAKMIKMHKYDPIGGLDALIEADWTGKVWGDHRFCDDCFEVKRTAWQTQKIDLWHKLDQWLFPQMVRSGHPGNLLRT